MNQKDFKRLVGPINMLIGYAKSAEDIGRESDLINWKARLVQLADKAATAWDEVSKPTDGDSK